MLYTALFAAAAAFSGLAAAQNQSLTLPSSIGPCCNVDSNEVPQNLKNAWCDASTNTCPEICGGQGQIANGGNTCDKTSLKWTCKCRNGTEPQMSNYQQSVPGQMCRFWFEQCTNATIGANGEGNDEEQFACDTISQQQCGNETTKDTSKTSSSSSKATASSTASGTGSDSGAAESSPTASGSGSEPSSTQGSAIRLAQEFTAPVLAGGLIALFGFAL